MRSPALSVLLATTLAAVPLWAQDVKDTPHSFTLAPAGAVALAAQAQALYKTGIAAGDPILVLAAAKLAAKTELVEGTAIVADPQRLQLAAEAQAGEGGGIAEKKRLLNSGAAPAPVMKVPDEAEPGVQRAKKQPVGTGAAPAPVMNVPEGAAPSVQAESQPGLQAAPDAAAAGGEAAAGRSVAKASFGAEASPDAAAEAPLDSAAMFAAAEALAAGDAALLEVIEDAKAEAGRGSIGSAGRYVSRLAPGTHDVWEIAYSAAALAEIAVIGNGAADLDVTITDAGGNVICYDVSSSDQLYCSWVPAWEGYFYITVENVGGGTNTYSLLSN